MTDSLTLALAQMNPTVGDLAGNAAPAEPDGLPAPAGESARTSISAYYRATLTPRGFRDEYAAIYG